MIQFIFTWVIIICLATIGAFEDMPVLVVIAVVLMITSSLPTTKEQSKCVITKTMEWRMQCVGCLNEIVGTPTTINEDGDQLCQICTFVIAMYQENGIDKKFSKGGLKLDLVSNNIRKAVKELLVNPKQTYEKYVPKTLEMASGIEISDEMMKGILTEEFPFVKLPLRQAEELNLKEGDLFRAHSKDGGFFRRPIMAMRKFTAKEAKEKGYGRSAFVAYFVPAEA